jgi:hypothetical protein
VKADKTCVCGSSVLLAVEVEDRDMKSNEDGEVKARLNAWP